MEMLHKESIIEMLICSNNDGELFLLVTDVL